MVRKNDLILLLVIFCSMGAGIGFPNLGKVFLPYPLYLMMFLLFLSFLKIEFVEVLQNIKKNDFYYFSTMLVKTIDYSSRSFFSYPSHLARICSSCLTSIRNLYRCGSAFYLWSFECYHFAGVDDGGHFLSFSSLYTSSLGRAPDGTDH